jgi:hypothetical protein
VSHSFVDYCDFDLSHLLHLRPPNCRMNNHPDLLAQSDRTPKVVQMNWNFLCLPGNSSSVSNSTLATLSGHLLFAVQGDGRSRCPVTKNERTNFTASALKKTPPHRTPIRDIPPASYALSCIEIILTHLTTPLYLICFRTGTDCNRFCLSAV